MFRTANAFTYLTLSFCFVLIASTAPEIVEILFGKEWLGAAPYVTILAMIGLIQGSRLLLSPVLTALGRPRDVLVAQVAELILVLGALLLLGAPSIGWALAIWAARECLGGVILATLLRRATGVDLRAHLATGVVPLACAAVMFGVLWECRSLLPVTWGLASRLAVLAPLGLGVYVACAFVLNRRLVVELLEFGHTAIRRPTRP